MEFSKDFKEKFDQIEKLCGEIFETFIIIGEQKNYCISTVNNGDPFRIVGLLECEKHRFLSQGI